MKIYNIKYSPAALKDMDKVWEEVYEASLDFDTAEKYVREFIEKIEQSRKFPCKGIPLEYRGLFTGFYYVNFKKYKAFYRIEEDCIEVIRIIMSKHNYMKALFGNADCIPEQ